MAKLSYPQLIQEIADAYRIASETTDKVAVKDLPTQISQLFNRLLANTYKSIVYNEDNTVTLIDHDDQEHTITPNYDIGKINSVMFDDKEIALDFSDGKLTSIDDKIIDLSFAPKNDGITSLNYKSIKYNDDNSITLIDHEDIEHTITCNYENGNMKSINFDGNYISIDYNEDILEGVGTIELDLSSAPTSNTANRYKAVETKAITVGVHDDPSPTRLTCVVQGSNNWYYHSFLDYDLSGIPQGSKILSARLFMFLPEHTDNLSNFKNYYTWIGKVTSAWDESIKWATQPTYTTQYGKYSDCKKLISEDVNTWINYDVTKLVQELVNDPQSNYGLTIINGDEGQYEAAWIFRNRRYTEKYGEDYSTYIEIFYE